MSKMKITIILFSLAMFPIFGEELSQIAEEAKGFIRCMVPLEHRVLLFGWQLWRSFEGTAVLIARVELNGEGYDLWTVPGDVYDAGKLIAESVGKPVLAVIEPIPSFVPFHEKFDGWITGPRLVITPPTDLIPLAALCPLPPFEGLEESLAESRRVVIVGFDERGGELMRFVSFAKIKSGLLFLSVTSSGYRGDFLWEHERAGVAGALVLAWKIEEGTPHFLPIGTYGPWEYRRRVWEWGRYTTETGKEDVMPLLPFSTKVTFSELPEWRALNIVRAAFGLELKPEPEEGPEVEW